jgi:hypothetical protein
MPEKISQDDLRRLQRFVRKPVAPREPTAAAAMYPDLKQREYGPLRPAPASDKQQPAKGRR